MAPPAAVEATVCAPVNIAVIKYWGKRDERLILPTNSSLSATLATDVLHSKTTARVHPGAGGDQLWLNGRREPPTARFAAVVGALRALRADHEQRNPSAPKLSQCALTVVSENNFPTAAGLASSASGYAALVVAVAHALGLPGIDTPHGASTLSAIARMGSGSACRSLFGGFVAWEMGAAPDGADSVAVQVAESKHWVDLEALVLVVHDGKKGVSSTSGMQTTVQTSTLAAHRFAQVVPDRMQRMKRAIQDRDFDTFAQLTIQDSNQFHAVCLDTYPPIFYMNDVSRALVHLVHVLNDLPVPGWDHRCKAAYTYDAGPNCVLYLPRAWIRSVVALVAHFFPGYEFADPYTLASYPSALPAEWDEAKLVQTVTERTKLQPHPAGSIKRILHAKIGDGPVVLHQGDPTKSTVSLIKPTGEPIKVVSA